MQAAFRCSQIFGASFRRRADRAPRQTPNGHPSALPFSQSPRRALYLASTDCLLARSRAPTLVPACTSCRRRESQLTDDLPDLPANVSLSIQTRPSPPGKRSRRTTAGIEGDPARAARIVWNDLRPAPCPWRALRQSSAGRYDDRQAERGSTVQFEITEAPGRRIHR